MLCTVFLTFFNLAEDSFLLSIASHTLQSQRNSHQSTLRVRDRCQVTILRIFLLSVLRRDDSPEESTFYFRLGSDDSGIAMDTSIFNNFNIKGCMMRPSASVQEIRENLHQFELQLREVKNSCKPDECCMAVLSADGRDDFDDSSIRHTQHVEPKRRTNTAETELSIQVSNTDESPCRLDEIGSYNDDECVIWYAHSNLSASADEDDYTSREVVTISNYRGFPDRDRAAGTTSLATLLPTELTSEAQPTQRSNTASGSKRKTKINTKKVDGGDSNPKKGNNFFSNRLSFTKKTEFLFRSKRSAAASRKAFSICKVPASIAEEASTTSSTTN